MNERTTAGGTTVATVVTPRPRTPARAVTAPAEARTTRAPATRGDERANEPGEDNHNEGNEPGEDNHNEGNEPGEDNHNQGNEPGEDNHNQGNDQCVAQLVEGAIVARAELDLEDGNATFEKIVVMPAAQEEAPAAPTAG